MADHAAIKNVVERVRSDAIGGAADTAKEVIEALSKLVADSKAKDVEMLVTEVDDAVLDIMRVIPSLINASRTIFNISGWIMAITSFISNASVYSFVLLSIPLNSLIQVEHSVGVLAMNLRVHTGHLSGIIEFELQQLVYNKNQYQCNNTGIANAD